VRAHQSHQALEWLIFFQIFSDVSFQFFFGDQLNNSFMAPANDHFFIFQSFKLKNGANNQVLGSFLW
jgi:hypothetical protein